MQRLRNVIKSISQQPENNAFRSLLSFHRPRLVQPVPRPDLPLHPQSNTGEQKWQEIFKAMDLAG